MGGYTCGEDIGGFMPINLCPAGTKIIESNFLSEREKLQALGETIF
jgi:hypothetical protein